MREFIEVEHSLVDTVFQDRFRQFSKHDKGNRWPHGYPGSGKPKDGAWLFNERGLQDVAVKLRGLPASSKEWPACGTRHETALEVAEFLREGIIICRSDSGSIHVLLCG